MSVKAIARLESPFVEKCVANPLSTCFYPGINYEVFRNAMTYLGLNYVLFLSDESTGGRDLNGTWHGILRNLTDNVVNITAYIIRMSADRLEAVDFSSPVTDFEMAFLLSRRDAPFAEGLSFSYDFMFHSSELLLGYGAILAAIWLCVFLALPIVSVQLLLRGSKLYRICESILIIAYDWSYRHVQRKLWVFAVFIFIEWNFATFFFNAYLEGNLHTSIITRRLRTPPFNTLPEFADLVLRRKYTLATAQDADDFLGWVEDEGRRMPGGPWAKIRSGFDVNPPRFFPNMSSLLAGLEQNTTLVYYDSYYLVNKIASEKCNLTAVKDTSSQAAMLAFAMSKRSGLRELFNQVLYPAGGSVDDFVHRLYRKYYRDARCSTEVILWSPQTPSLNLEHLQAVLAGLLLIYGLATISFFVELYLGS